MATYNSYQEMEVFKIARQISNEVWHLMNNIPLGKDFELRNQINSSSGSVMDNIAEGYGRGGNKEFINFLGYARGSCSETEAQLLWSFDRNHISQETLDEMMINTKSCIDQISKFILYLKKSNKRGSKFD
jgi:four helix bundle protein